MKTYFFVLGTNHTLSKIDIVNMLVGWGVNFEIIEASEEVLIISVEGELDVRALMGELGSAAKIGIILKEKVKENFEENIEEALKEKFRGERFGISVYGAGGKFKELSEVFYSSRRIAKKIREIRDVREVREQGRVLSTVAVDKNGLLDNGLELVVCVGSKGIYVGKTLSIQDYESYSLRDYGRPGRDAKAGMIPPKLAKVMINLAGKDKKDLFLDPFCGSGTFLQELLLLGYNNVIGADVEEKAIEDTQKNLEWLKNNFADVAGVDKIKLIKSDARTLSSEISYKTIDAIVTEPYLGSPKIRFFTSDQIRHEVNKLEDLYISAFLEFKKILKENGAVVIIFPVFRFKHSFFKLEILDELGRMGFVTKGLIARGINYRTVRQLADAVFRTRVRKSLFLRLHPSESEGFRHYEIKGDELLKLQITDRNSVIFFRPGQVINREIFVFALS